MNKHRMRILPALLLGAALAWPASAIEREIPFDDYVVSLKRQAIGQGISVETVDAAFANVALRERVVKQDRSQPERTRMTLERYLPRAVPDWKVEQARDLYQEHKVELDEIAAKYGVQARFIVALWGVESNFGRYTGNESVISALTTLAYEGRREAFFTRELMAALKILDQGHINVDEMKGSWAGAMGQTQFMPSSFLAFAQDYDGDGHKDIWHTRVDVFASIANYLSKSGWDETLTWGRQVKLPRDIDLELATLKQQKPLAQWQSLGVRRYDGSALPVRDVNASLVLPDGPDGRAFLVYENYRTLMKWNRSTYFATSVGHLSDRIIWPPHS